jgi:aspartate/methionine/tyrosine aminotransferase
MSELSKLSADDLRARHEEAVRRHAAFAARGLRLNMARGKPSPEQLDLANGIFTLVGKDDFKTAGGVDGRNYELATGIPEARSLFAPIVGAPAEQVIVAYNSSLAHMHDSVVFALLHGVPGGTPWSKQAVKFLCPVPGYDRHFTICERFGIEMVSVPLRDDGPDMDTVERLVKDDAAVKGIWCVPKHSNPTGAVYSNATVDRLASMKTAAPDFRIFWDNAYAIHDFVDGVELANILDACARHGHDNRAFVYASTSKITFAGAGVAVFASSKDNVAWMTKEMSARTIGPDKLNQLRHVRFLRDEAGLYAHMKKHRAILAPKFDAVDAAFTEHLKGTGTATWTKPRGGYFISLDVPPGCASRVVDLAKQAGIVLTPAGATHPYGKDPEDQNIRIAPSFPSLAEIKDAAEGIALSVLVASTEKLERARKS